MCYVGGCDITDFDLQILDTHAHKNSKKKTEVQNLQYHMKASEAHLHKEKWIKKIIKVSQPLQSMTEIACQMRQLWRACDMGIPLTLLTVLVTKGNGESLA